MTDDKLTFEEWCTDENMGVNVKHNGSHVECARAAWKARDTEIADLRARIQKTTEALDSVQICVWADNFSDFDAKLVAIDSIATRVLVWGRSHD